MLRSCAGAVAPSQQKSIKSLLSTIVHSPLQGCKARTSDVVIPWTRKSRRQWENESSKCQMDCIICIIRQLEAEKERAKDLLPQRKNKWLRSAMNIRMQQLTSTSSDNTKIKEGESETTKAVLELQTWGNWHRRTDLKPCSGKPLSRATVCYPLSSAFSTSFDEPQHTYGLG